MYKASHCANEVTAHCFHKWRRRRRRRKGRRFRFINGRRRRQNRSLVANRATGEDVGLIRPLRSQRLIRAWRCGRSAVPVRGAGGSAARRPCRDIPPTWRDTDGHVTFVLRHDPLTSNWTLHTLNWPREGTSFRTYFSSVIYVPYILCFR